MSRISKKYDEDFKKSSVELFFKSGKKQRAFARELGVIPETFRGWVDKYREAYEPEPVTDFSILKREEVGRKNYRSIQEARIELFDYIEIFYNRHRAHSTLNYRAPMEVAA